MEPTEDDIDAVMNECAERIDSGDSKYPGMSYEQGVQAALDWVRGLTDNNPMED